MHCKIVLACTCEALWESEGKRCRVLWFLGLCFGLVEALLCLVLLGIALHCFVLICIPLHCLALLYIVALLRLGLLVIAWRRFALLCCALFSIVFIDK